MGKSKNNWREETRRIIRAYPTLEREEKELREMCITSSLSGMPGGGGVSRKTEDVATRTLAAKKQRELNAVRLARITTMNRYANAKARLDVIEMVYWKKTHTLEGAALKCNYSYAAVKEWNANFIGLVDAYMRILKSLSFSQNDL